MEALSRAMRGAILLVGLLGGCATMSGDPIKSANVTGNEVSVTVNNVWNANQAMKIADAHCQKYGRAARFAQKSGEYAFAFDCVKP